MSALVIRNWSCLSPICIYLSVFFFFSMQFAKQKSAFAVDIDRFRNHLVDVLNDRGLKMSGNSYKREKWLK